jgi:hypothetical protein
MTTSGTYIFDPDLAELVDEAMERARIDPAKITVRHILSARRSMSFMLKSWATKDFHDFRIRQDTMTLVQSQAAYVAGTDFDLDAGGVNILDILDVALRRDGVDTPVTFMPRSELLNIPDKDTEGRPDRVFIDKQRDGITMTFWTVPENSTDVIVFNAVRKFEDSDAASNNADIHDYLLDAFAYGLAFRLAEKFSPPELEAALYQKAEIAFKEAQDAVRERGDVRIVPDSSHRRRRGSARHYR